MKIKYFIILSFLTIIGSAFFADKILSQETTVIADIQYPIKELGNCKNEKDCRAYCDEPTNIDDCLDFAKKNRLMSEGEVEMAQRFLEAENTPGNCKNEEECKAYCDNIDHIDECISFAERNNLIPPEELEEAKRVQSAIKRGVKPPPCGNKKQCDIYCEEPNHMEECIAFGVEAGFIEGKEAEDAQKMLQAVKRGVKPPPCKGRKACDEYCSSPENMEVCMNFAIEAGFMSEEEKANSQKMLQALKKGVKPPPCRGREECDVYCSSEEHLEECMNFAVAAGFMSEEDAKMARKTGGKGPGNCRGKEECEAFCNNPDNQETCFNFAKDNGLIPEEDLKKMEEGKQQFRQSLEQMPQEALDCLQGKVGTDVLLKMKSGEFMPGPQIGDQMQECFQMMGPPQGFEGEGPRESPCQSEEECRQLFEQCQAGSNDPRCEMMKQGPPQSEQPGSPKEGILPRRISPGFPAELEGKCTDAQQCASYCFQNPSDPGCQNQNQESYPPEGQEQYEQQYQQQFEQQYQQQLQQQQLQLQQQQLQLQQQQIELQQQYQQQPMQEYQPPAESAPPPPPPSAFLKPDSFLGALLYPLAKAFYHVR